MLMVFIAALLLATPAYAEDYASTNYVNLIKTLVRFGTFDINDDDLIDNYAMVVECEIYKNHYHDDFKWNKARAALRKAIRQDVSSFPTAYRYAATLQLGRYDFKKKMYNFSENTSVRNVNVFTIENNGRIDCYGKQPALLPTMFRMVLNEPLNITGLPLPEGDANILMKRMDESGNQERLVYSDFNIRITFIAPLYRAKRSSVLEQDKGVGVRMDARLESVNFYSDPERTKLIYSYRP